MQCNAGIMAAGNLAGLFFFFTNKDCSFYYVVFTLAITVLPGLR